MSRMRASTNHLILSIVIFSSVIFILLFFWYPAPYFTASGGWQGLKIAASVDLVLGPLLTLIVFDNKKSRNKLVFDFLVIFLLQFSALIWGVKTIYDQRPVAVAFFENDFITVPASALTEKGTLLQSLKPYGDDYPVFVYVNKPTDKQGLMEMNKLILERAIPPHEQVGLYQPLAGSYQKIQPNQANIREIIDSNSKMKADLMAILEKSGTTIDDYDFYPLRSKYKNIILLFSHEGEWLDYIMVNPRSSEEHED